MAARTSTREQRRSLRCVGCIILLGAACFVFTHAAVGQVEWSSVIHAEPANSADREHWIALYAVSLRDKQLTGTVSYRNGPKDGKAATALILKGTKSANGVFWPNATLQVKRKGRDKWQTVGRSTNTGAAASITIPRDGFNNELRVHLDALRPFLRTHDVGRIVFDNGEFGEFDLFLLTSEGTPPQAE